MLYLAMDEYYEFNSEENALLKQERGISFEEVIAAIEAGQLLDILAHPNKEKFENQKLYIVAIDYYAYVIPFVEKENSVFLKTIFPSRKLTKLYLEHQEDKQ